MSDAQTITVSYSADMAVETGDQWRNYLSIDLDQEEGPYVFVSSTFGNGQSMASFYGYEQSLVKLPNSLTPVAVQMVFEELKENFEDKLIAIFQDCEKKWDGNNHVCRLGEEADEATREIRDHLEQYIDSGLPSFWEASDYFQEFSSNEIGRTFMNSEASCIQGFWEDEFEDHTGEFEVKNHDAIRYLRNALTEFVENDLEKFLDSAQDEEGVVPQEVLARAAILCGIVH